MWQRARSTSKVGFDKLWGWADKLGAPANRLTNKVGSEAFWPTTLDKECDKAARILRSFCKDGFYEDTKVPTQEGEVQDENEQVEDGPSKKRYQKVLKKIPMEVIQNAKGLAIFTTMRTGLWISGAGGSGVLVARLPDGSWSAPSGILLHTAGVGFLVGIDIYDCVVVLNTDEAVAAFTKIRCTLGGEISAVAGPVGMGGVVDTEVHKRRSPIFTYLKSRGFYAGVQMDGSIIIERSDENERFYGRKVTVADILAGKVTRPPDSIQTLISTIKAAQGDTDVDPALLPIEAPPSDFDIANGHVFGVPDRDDPDPYGVAALEKEGIGIREAGTQKRVSRESFQFMPSPSSPLFGAFNSGPNRMSTDLDSRRSSWKTNTSSQMVDMATQTELGPPTLPQRSGPPALPPRPQSATFASSMAGIPEMESIDQKIRPSTGDGITSKGVTTETPKFNQPTEEGFEEVPLTGSPVEMQTESKDQPPAVEIATQTLAPEENHPIGISRKTEHEIHQDTPKEVEAAVEAEKPAKSSTDAFAHLPTPEVKGDEEADADDEDSDDDDDDDAVFHEVVQAAAPTFVTAAPQVVTKARLVNVAKPIPPALPSRNPNRALASSSRDNLRPSLNVDSKPNSSEDVRPISRGSSVYSLNKEEEDVPSSAKGSDSHGSISSVDHPETFHDVAKILTETNNHTKESSMESVHDSSNADSSATLTPSSQAVTGTIH